MEPDIEDDVCRGYVLEERGDYLLMRVENKRDGKVTFVLGHMVCGTWVQSRYPSEQVAREAFWVRSVA